MLESFAGQLRRCLQVSLDEVVYFESMKRKLKIKLYTSVGVMKDYKLRDLCGLTHTGFRSQEQLKQFSNYATEAWLAFKDNWQRRKSSQSLSPGRRSRAATRSAPAAEGNRSQSVNDRPGRVVARIDLCGDEVCVQFTFAIGFKIVETVYVTDDLNNDHHIRNTG
jgi:hypothetical protein